MEFPNIPEELRIRRLNPPSGRTRIVMDTDTFNEIDDQFAVIHALLSPKQIDTQAFYAAPFYNSLSDSPKDGMEKSFREIGKILNIMHRKDIPTYQGSDRYLPDAHTPVESEAARNLVERAMASDDDDPLTIVAIGAITNVASALLMEPRMVEKANLIWLGGHDLHWPDTVEFNLHQDVPAARVVLDSGIPLTLIPCLGVASHLHTTLSEIKDYIRDYGKIGEYLYETFKRCSADHFAYSRVIWDLTATAYLVNPEWLPSALVHSPLVSEDSRWSADPHRHLIRCVRQVNRDAIFKDLFQKIQQYA